MKNKNAFYTAGITLLIVCMGLIPETNPDLQPPVPDHPNHLFWTHKRSTGHSIPTSGQVSAPAPVCQDQTLLRDYELDIQMDTIKVYDGYRFVGKVITTWNSRLDTLILNDNQ